MDEEVIAGLVVIGVVIAVILCIFFWWIAPSKGYNKGVNEAAYQIKQCLDEGGELGLENDTKNGTVSGWFCIEKEEESEENAEVQ